jgi:hypothetical protein
MIGMIVRKQNTMEANVSRKELRHTRLEDARTQPAIHKKRVCVLFDYVGVSF